MRRVARSGNVLLRLALRQGARLRPGLRGGAHFHGDALPDDRALRVPLLHVLERDAEDNTFAVIFTLMRQVISDMQSRNATLEDYEQVMSTAVAAAAAWRQLWRLLDH